MNENKIAIANSIETHTKKKPQNATIIINTYIYDRLLCDSTNDNICNDTTINCRTNYDQTCDMKYNSTSTEWICQGDCQIPSPNPTLSPTPPTIYPTTAPSTIPTITPTNAPVIPPTIAPSYSPTVIPSGSPSLPPTRVPSDSPTVIPSGSPSLPPTNAPSDNPTAIPSGSPSIPPTQAPSISPTIIPTRNPTQIPTNAPTDNPSAIPSGSPSLPPTQAPSISPTSIPTRNPTQTPSNAPTNTPTDSPTDSPTKSPTEITGSKVIKIYYRQSISSSDVAELSIILYAQDLENALNEVIYQLSNDTRVDSICQNNTAPDGIDCGLSNYNPFISGAADDGADLERRRRRMLNDRYSYKIGNDNGNSTGWWQARVEHLSICVVLTNINIDPQHCSEDVYNEHDLYIDNDNIENERYDFIAFGTFDVVAASNAENYFSYLEGKVNNNTAVLQVMKNIMYENSNFSYLAGFDPFGVSIGNVTVIVEEITVDDYANTAFTVTLGLYAFMGVCALIAFLGRIHAFVVDADNVRVMGK